MSGVKYWSVLYFLYIFYTALIDFLCGCYPMYSSHCSLCVCAKDSISAAAGFEAGRPTSRLWSRPRYQSALLILSCIVIHQSVYELMQFIDGLCSTFLWDNLRKMKMSFYQGGRQLFIIVYNIQWRIPPPPVQGPKNKKNAAIFPIFRPKYTCMV